MVERRSEAGRARVDSGSLGAARMHSLRILFPLMLLALVFAGASARGEDGELDSPLVQRAKAALKTVPQAKTPDEIDRVHTELIAYADSLERLLW